MKQHRAAHRSCTLQERFSASVRHVIYYFVVFVCLFGSCFYGVAAEPRQVPKLKGQRTTIAKQVVGLSNLRYAEGVFYIAPKNWREEIRPGVIYMQTPQPGGNLAEGMTVACWTFAKATENQKVVQMPNLVGLSPQKAKQRIAEQGLSLVVPLTLPEGDTAQATVRGQYPRADQNIYQGTSVYVLFNDGSSQP